MRDQDYQVLFTALAFMAITLTKHDQDDDLSLRVQNFARLIEAFCRQTVPDAFVSVPEQPCHEDR